MVNQKNKLFIILGCLVLVLLVFLLTFSFVGDNNFTFVLNGQQNMYIFKNEKFVDPLFIAFDENGKDLSNYVKVSGNVDTWTLGSYEISYVLNYKGTKRKLIRNVIVLDNIIDNYEIKLNGSFNVYIKMGNRFVDPGYFVYDRVNNNKVNFNLIVNNYVDTSHVGKYKVEYVLKIGGKEKKSIREVEVYSLNYSLKTETDNTVVNSLNIIFDASYERNFSSIKLPNGTTSMSNKINYPVTENGEYKFVINDKFGNSEEKIITVNNISSNLKCSGNVSRYGTNLNVTGNNLSSAKSFVWDIDGVEVNGNSVYKNSLKAVDSASVMVNFNNSNMVVKCNIINDLSYRFVYDEYNQKSYIKCDTYNANDRMKYESILKDSVNKAGYGTRAGVVEAARFLVGGLSYKVEYLGTKAEDTRLGRYDKVGLNIGYSDGWGCRVGTHIQGMDCTNFVYWAFKQAGLKLSGVYNHYNTYSVNSVINNLKVGDLLLTPASDGIRNYTHVGIIIGIDDNYIYVAEATTGNINAIVVTKWNKFDMPKKGKFSVAKLYKYASDGNITNMWVS